MTEHRKFPPGVVLTHHFPEKLRGLPVPNDKPKELLRVGFREPMSVARLLDVIKFSNAEDDDLVRVFNGNLIFTRPVTNET